MNEVKAFDELKDEMKYSQKFNGRVSVRAEVAEAILVALGHMFPDNCEVCKGKKGGVRGNENIVDGKIMCDYCTVSMSKERA